MANCLIAMMRELVRNSSAAIAGYMGTIENVAPHLLVQSTDDSGSRMETYASYLYW